MGTRIYNLRKPKTNIQILQQNVLLKHKHLAAFLRRFAREVYLEVGAWAHTHAHAHSHSPACMHSGLVMADNGTFNGQHACIFEACSVTACTCI